MLAEFRPLPCVVGKPNPDVHSYRDGIFVLSLNILFAYHPTPGNYATTQLKGDMLIPSVYHRTRFGQKPYSVHQFPEEPIGEGGFDPIIWRALRLARLLDDRPEEDEEADEEEIYGNLIALDD